MNKTHESWIKLGWVRTIRLAQLKGHSVDAIKKDKSLGLFIEGIHWNKDLKGRIWWDYEAFDQLIKQGF